MIKIQLQINYFQFLKKMANELKVEMITCVSFFYILFNLKHSYFLKKKTFICITQNTVPLSFKIFLNNLKSYCNSCALSKTFLKCYRGNEAFRQYMEVFFWRGEEEGST